MDVRGNIVKLSDGTQISYDKCLIATGKLLDFFLFVLCLVPGFLFQQRSPDREVSAVCVKHLAELSHGGQSHSQPCHWVFRLPRISQLLWDVQSFALKFSREGGKGDFLSGSVRELLCRPASSNPACSSSRQSNRLLLGQSTAPASIPSSSTALCG